MKYLLVNKKVVHEPGLMKWAHAMEKSERVIKQERLKGFYISTIFLGINHNYGEGKPLLFETMVFSENKKTVDDVMDGRTMRYTNYIEAEQGHQEIVNQIKEKK